MKNTTNKTGNGNEGRRAVDEETMGLLSKRCADYLSFMDAIAQPAEQVVQHKKQNESRAEVSAQNYEAYASEKLAEEILKVVKGSTSPGRK